MQKNLLICQKKIILSGQKSNPTVWRYCFSYEATLGRYALIPKDFYGCLGRRLAIIRNVSKDIDTLWLYYYFLSPEWKQFIQSKIIKGSTVNRISVEDFPTYTVPNISIKVQRKIANILSKIDEKSL